MRIISAAGLIAVLGCSTPPAPTPPDPRVQPIAESYASYGKVDDLSRWAPELCKAPMPPKARMSISKDPETHGRKLYFLYAKDRKSYMQAAHIAQPVGQVLVKESWVPAESSTFSNPKTGDRGPLYLMIKTGDADSDGGWIYATATPDGKTVTAAGKLASCMECHESKVDKLFGPKSCASSSN